MVFYKDNKWHMSDLEVTFKDGGEKDKKYVGLEGKSWWDNLAKMFDDIEVVEFNEVLNTDEQLTRLEKVNAINTPDGHGSVVSEYVRLGEFPDSLDHVLKNIELEEVSREQGVDLSEREIEAMQLALQISDLELRLLELGGGK